MAALIIDRPDIRSGIYRALALRARHDAEDDVAETVRFAARSSYASVNRLENRENMNPITGREGLIPLNDIAIHLAFRGLRSRAFGVLDLIEDRQNRVDAELRVLIELTKFGRGNEQEITNLALRINSIAADPRSNALSLMEETVLLGALEMKIGGQAQPARATGVVRAAQRKVRTELDREVTTSRSLADVAVRLHRALEIVGNSEEEGVGNRAAVSKWMSTMIDEIVPEGNLRRLFDNTMEALPGKWPKKERKQR